MVADRNVSPRCWSRALTSRSGRCCRPGPRTHLHHRARRQARQHDRACLRGEQRRHPRSHADARLHLVTHRIGDGRQMHVQVRGDVVVYPRDGRRVQLRLRTVGARRLIT